MSVAQLVEHTTFNRKVVSSNLTRHIHIILIKYNFEQIVHTVFEVNYMNKKTQEQIQEQKNHDKFNSITQKVAPENQNQTHNSRKEGIQEIKQKK